MELLRSYVPEIIVGLIVLVVIQFILLAIQSARTTRLYRLLKMVLTDPQGQNLTQQLQRSVEESVRAQDAAQNLELHVQTLEATLKDCSRLHGLVHYDAYADVSGQQSFSLALLDGHHNGVIITALYGRNNASIFSKSVRAGTSDRALSDEENNALQQALEKDS